jgi:hypothetical protein
MAFEYPSTITARKEKKKKAKKDSGYKVTEKEFSKITKPVFDKEGPKGEIAFDQLDAALSAKNIGDGKKITKKGLKNIVDAAADDKQLTRTKRSILRNYKSGGRAGYKGGGMSQRGLGRAFMKGGKV